MTLLDRVKHIPHGAVTIGKWLGEGGQVVDYETAQARAITCNSGNGGKRCENNVAGFKPTEAVALAVKRFLEVKNHVGLRVKGEHALGTCSACGCVLRLLVWEEQEKVRRELTDDERTKLPSYCWKIV